VLEVLSKLNDSYSVPHKIDVDELQDLKQNILIRFYHKLKTRNFTSIENSKSYLWIACRNSLIDNIRKKGHKQFFRFEELELQKFQSLFLTQHISNIDDSIESLISPIRERTFNEISEEYKTIIMRLYEGVSVQQIAAELNLDTKSKRAFKQKLYRARLQYWNLLKTNLTYAVDNKDINDLDREILKQILKKVQSKRYFSK
jgi:RNA polymerase sigma factor (sigma-70 family)